MLIYLKHEGECNLKSGLVDLGDYPELLLEPVLSSRDKTSADVKALLFRIKENMEEKQCRSNLTMANEGTLGYTSISEVLATK